MGRGATGEMVEISVKGKWVNVPAIKCGDCTIIVTGNSIKIARVNDEAWIETELEDPEECVKMLRASRQRCDILTFTQLPPGRGPRFNYHHEPDSIAAVKTHDFQTVVGEFATGNPEEREEGRETGGEGQGRTL